MPASWPSSVAQATRIHTETMRTRVFWMSNVEGEKWTQWGEGRTLSRAALKCADIVG